MQKSDLTKVTSQILQMIWPIDQIRDCAEPKPNLLVVDPSLNVAQGFSYTWFFLEICQAIRRKE